MFFLIIRPSRRSKIFLHNTHSKSEDFDNLKRALMLSMSSILPTTNKRFKFKDLKSTLKSFLKLAFKIINLFCKWIIDVVSYHELLLPYVLWNLPSYKQKPMIISPCDDIFALFNGIVDSFCPIGHKTDPCCGHRFYINQENSLFEDFFSKFVNSG